MITFPCPHCGVNISAEPEHYGASANCPSCSGDLVVPAGSDELPRSVISPNVRILPPVPGRKKPIPNPGKRKSLIIALILVMVVAGSVFMIKARRDSTDLANPEVVKSIQKEAIEKKALQSREKNGKIVLYRPNDEKPFTGWMKETSSGGELELAKIKNGILNGPYVAYLKSGQKVIEGTNINGVKDGRQTSWYENGQLKSEMIFKKDKVKSLIVNYKPNGDKCSESKVENGSGKLLMYDAKGAVFGTIRYESGEGIGRFNEPGANGSNSLSMASRDSTYSNHYKANQRDRHVMARYKDAYDVAGTIGKRNGYNDLEVIIGAIDAIDWSDASPQLRNAVSEVKSIRNGESRESGNKKLKMFTEIVQEYGL